MLRNRKVVSVCVVLALCLVGTIRGQQTATSISPKAPTVGAGDLLDIAIFESPDLSGHFRVNENGNITSPLLGQVHVEGLTVEEVGKLLESKYEAQHILIAPTGYAQVQISESVNQRILISGDVKSPGFYPAYGVRMLHDMITAAGGILATASTKLIVTHRSDPDHPISVYYNPDALRPIIPMVQILPGDTIMVPRAGAVYALGNITRPGLYVLNGRDPLTLERLIALAGSTGNAAATKRVHIVRTEEGMGRMDVVVALKLIIQGKAPDVVLKDGDIVYVPTSKATLITERTLESAIGIGTSVATYRVATSQ